MSPGDLMRIRTPLAGAVVAVVAFLSPVASATPAVAAAKDPVIIVAGTFAGEGIASVYYAPLATRLRAEGYQPFIFGLPGSGLGDIAATSQALNAFADQVRVETGATRVDLIGHSQGGLVGRYYIKYIGGAGEVDSMISLAAPHYGTTLANLAKLLGLGSCLGVVACQQMAIGSTFLANLNAGDDTIGGVDYTNFATVLDEIVTPYTERVPQQRRQQPQRADPVAVLPARRRTHHDPTRRHDLQRNPGHARAPTNLAQLLRVVTPPAAFRERT